MNLGIIGGADGPTQIIVSSTPGWGWMILGAAVLAAAVIMIRRHRKHRG